MATHFNLGMAYKDLKEYEKAIKAFKKSLKANSVLMEAQYQIAQIYLAQNNPDAALESIQLAIQAVPTNLVYQKLRDKIISS